MRGATKLAPSTVNRILAAVSSFYEYVTLAGMFERLNPIEKRPDPALQRISERHRPFMGGASRQQPVRRAVRVKTVQRVPRPIVGVPFTVLAATSVTRVRCGPAAPVGGGAVTCWETIYPSTG